MKFRTSMYLLALVAPVAGLLRGEIAFNGYLVTADGPSFALSDEDKQSGWMKIGQTFEGFTIVGFDPKREAVVLENGGERREIWLSAGRIREAEAEDGKARLQRLKGLELAYELAKRGDEKIADLLKRHQEAQLSLQRGEGNLQAAAFLKAQVEKVAAARAAQLLAEK